MKKQKIFPPPVQPYDAAKHLREMEATAAEKLDHYPWSARALGVVVAALFWAVLAAVVFGLWLGGADKDALLYSFLIGGGASLVFSLPFLWK